MFEPFITPTFPLVAALHVLFCSNARCRDYDWFPDFVFAGAFTLPLQAAFNRQLGGVVLTPYRATFVSCVIGLVFLGVCTMISTFIEEPQFVGVEVRLQCVKSVHAR